MKSLFVFSGFLFLAALARIAVARKDPGEYWQHVMKDEPMPEFIQGLVGTSKVTCTDNKNNGHFHITSQKTSLDPLTSATAYTNDDVKPKNDKHFMKNQLKPRSNTPGYRNNRNFRFSSGKTSLDPVPSLTAYTDNVGPSSHEHFAKELNPSPNVSAYSDDVKPEGGKMFTKEFEPSPNVSAYSDDAKPEGEKLFAKEFDPTPNLTAYSDDVKPEGEKMFTKEFEPSPNVSVYSDGVKPEDVRFFTKEFEPSPNLSAYTDGIIELKAEN